MRLRSSCGAPSGPGRNGLGSRSELSAVVMGLWAASACGLYPPATSSTPTTISVTLGPVVVMTGASDLGTRGGGGVFEHAAVAATVPHSAAAASTPPSRLMV